MTDSEGNITELDPTYVTDYNLEAVIPGTMAPGSYRVVAIKQGRESNPVNLTIKTNVSIDNTVCHGNTLSITGSGFGEYSNAANSGTAVTVQSEPARIISWSDTMIRAQASGCNSGSVATVDTIFGSTSATVQ